MTRLTLTPEEGGQRLDQYLAGAVEGLTRSGAQKLLEEGRARVKVLTSGDKWHGVTYREDRPDVVRALADMTAGGLYPAELWGG